MRVFCPSWRQGFVAAYGPAASSGTPGVSQSGPEHQVRR